MEVTLHLAHPLLDSENFGDCSQWFAPWVMSNVLVNIQKLLRGRRHRQTGMISRHGLQKLLLPFDLRRNFGIV